MSKRCLVYIAIIIFVLSMFFINNISYAGPSLGDWINAAQKVDNADSIMRTERDQYHYIQDDLKTLIGLWEDDIASRNNQRQLTVLATTGAIISIAASGGFSYPAAYVVAVAAAKLIHSETTSNASDYLTSMSALLSLMDSARYNVNAAYYGGYLSQEPPGSYLGPVVYYKCTPGYLPEYDAYLSMAVKHMNTYEYTGGTLTLPSLTSTVKAGGSGLQGWYHKKSHVGDSSSQEDHVFDKFMTFGDYVVKPDLESKYECKGNYSDCLTKYRTPYEAFSAHRTTCDGCGKDYYKCNTDDVDWHKERPCTREIVIITKTYVLKKKRVIDITTRGPCNIKHRWCMNDKSPHKKTIYIDGSIVYGSKTDHYPRRPPPSIGGYPPINVE